MQLETQILDLIQSDDPKQTHYIDVGDHAIPVRFLKSRVPTKTLIITFHGAIDRTTREVPAFVPFSPALAKGAHQISISDPSMLTEGDFSLSWYAGDKSIPSQDVLKTFFSALDQTMETVRTIYFGTSGGGFAALYYSWHHPGSIAVVGNPQTKITNYYSGHIDRYSTACWPENDNLADVICEDLGPLYAKKIPNFVIYVQSATDTFHAMKHMTPFLAALTYRKYTPLILNVDYFGRLGHGPTFDAYLPWLQAAMMVETVTTEDIVKAKHLIVTNDAPAPSAPAKSSPTKTRDDHKIQTANLIRDWQLGDDKSWPQTHISPKVQKPSGDQPSQKNTSLISKIFGSRSR